MSNLDLFKVAEIELVYRSNVPPKERPAVHSSKDAYELFLKNWDFDKIEFIEESKMMMLNRSSRVLGMYQISSGGTSGTVVDPKQVFAAALKANAHSIIISHNHPSGNLVPSLQDIHLTKAISQGGMILGISLLDHVILSKQGYYSFADECQL